jgi:hypothetical protein
MEANSTQFQESTGKAPGVGSGKRKWPVTAVGLLLLLEALFLAGIFPALVVLEFSKLPGGQLGLLFPAGGGIAPLHVYFSGLGEFLLTVQFASVSVAIPARITTSAIFGLLSPLLLVTGIAFLNQWRRAWMLAVFLQALFLSLALIFYFNLRHGYVYLVMLYSSYLVFYLNHHDVKIAFPDRRLETRKAVPPSARVKMQDP